MWYKVSFPLTLIRTFDHNVGSAFKIKQCGFGERIHWFRVYGRPIHVKKSMLFQKYPHSCGSYPNFGRVSSGQILR